MKKIIHTLNGQAIEALFLDTIGTTEGNFWHIYYAQGRVIQCTKDDKEIAHFDVLTWTLDK